MYGQFTRGASAGFAALVGHAAIVAMAVYATAAGKPTERAPTPAVAMIYVDKAPDRTTDRSSTLSLSPPASLSVEAPTAVVDGLPPLDLVPPFEMRGYTPRVPNGDRAADPFGSAPYPVGMVERAPEPLAGSPLDYPPFLRQAGIEGRVEVEAVVDTAGRVERNTLRVVLSSHPGFEDAALQYLREALYRPGEVGGRAVRVLVRQPIEFRLRR